MKKIKKSSSCSEMLLASTFFLITISLVVKFILDNKGTIFKIIIVIALIFAVLLILYWVKNTKKKSSCEVANNELLSDELDVYLIDCGKLLIEKNKASIGLLQRVFKISYERAEKIFNQLIEYKVIDSDSRKILMTMDEFNNLISKKFYTESNCNDFSFSHSNGFDLMEGHQFECFCGELLKKNGYTNVKVTRDSGDQGIDILAVKDGIKYGIQCKCYSSNVGNKAVQEAFSGKTFYKCHIAVVLTNRYFTQPATELAQSNGVLLWDRDKLKELVVNAENN